MRRTISKVRKDQICRYFKILVIIELIVSYMALLNLISHVCDDVKFEVDKEHPILFTDDFQQFAGQLDKTADMLQFSNTNYGDIVGYEGDISLAQFEYITVSFTIDCPTEVGVGSILLIDLYDFETGYDFTEQEHQVTVEKGCKTYELDFYRGAVFPYYGKLRFFTADPGAYSIKEIQVYPRLVLPKITPKMIAVTAICLAATAITCEVWYFFKNNNGSGGLFGGEALEEKSRNQ